VSNWIVSSKGVVKTPRVVNWWAIRNIWSVAMSRASYEPARLPAQTSTASSEQKVSVLIERAASSSYFCTRS
jgi:hypothetical protein